MIFMNAMQTADRRSSRGIQLRGTGPAHHCRAVGRAAIRIGLIGMLPLIGGCIGDLPPADYSCLAARGEYDRYNEVYVFSPRGEKKQEALMRAREAEQACAAEQGTAAPTGARGEP
jgi:hypothetical protein